MPQIWQWYFHWWSRERKELETACNIKCCFKEYYCSCKKHIIKLNYSNITWKCILIKGIRHIVNITAKQVGSNNNNCTIYRNHILKCLLQLELWKFWYNNWWNYSLHSYSDFTMKMPCFFNMVLWATYVKVYILKWIYLCFFQSYIFNKYLLVFFLIN